MCCTGVSLYVRPPFPVRAMLAQDWLWPKQSHELCLLPFLMQGQVSEGVS